MISWVAMDRIVERKRAADGAYRTEGADKVLRSDAKRLTDGELLAKLSSFGIEMYRPKLEGLCDQALSAEEIAQPLLDQRTFHGRHEQMESDWIWICLSALWQRWFRDKPSFEALDDKMQAGYELRESGAVAVCRVWLEAWSDVLRILDKAGMRSIQEFDEQFGGSQSLFNWIQDLEGELWNAGLEDRQFLTARIARVRRGVAALSHRRRSDDREPAARLGGVRTTNWARSDKAEALYRGWLHSGSALGMGLDRLVGLLPIHAHGGARLEPLRTDPAGRACHSGCQGPCGYSRPPRRCVR